MKNYLQLLDSDGEQFGLIKTNCDLETAERKWVDYYNLQAALPENKKEQVYPDDTICADGFVKYLRMEGFKVKRIFTHEITPAYQVFN